MPPTSFTLFIPIICILVIYSVCHMMIAFSSVISTPFLSRHLWFYLIWFHQLLYTAAGFPTALQIHILLWDSSVLSWIDQRFYHVCSSKNMSSFHKKILFFCRHYSSNVWKSFLTVMSSFTVLFLCSLVLMSHSIMLNISFSCSLIKNRNTLYWLLGWMSWSPFLLILVANFPSCFFLLWNSAWSPNCIIFLSYHS